MENKSILGFFCISLEQQELYFFYPLDFLSENDENFSYKSDNTPPLFYCAPGENVDS